MFQLKRRLADKDQCATVDLLLTGLLLDYLYLGNEWVDPTDYFSVVVQ